MRRIAGLNRIHIASMRKTPRSRARPTSSSASAAFIVNAFSSSTGVPCSSARRARSAWLSWVVAMYTRSRSSRASNPSAVSACGMSRSSAKARVRAASRPATATSSKASRWRKSGTIMSAIQPVPMMPTRSRWSLVMAPR